MSVLALMAASLAAFGAAAWEAFFSAGAGLLDIYAGHAIFMGGLTSAFGALLALGSGRPAAFFVQAVVTVLAAGTVALVWRAGARAELPIRAAVLLAATPVAVPVFMFYDLMLVLVSLVWLSRVRPAFGGPWVTGIAAAVYLGPLLSGNLEINAHWLVAFVTASLAFALTIAVAWRSPARPGCVVSAWIVKPRWHRS